MATYIYVLRRNLYSNPLFGEEKLYDKRYFFILRRKNLKNETTFLYQKLQIINIYFVQFIIRKLVSFNKDF